MKHQLRLSDALETRVMWPLRASNNLGVRLQAKLASHAPEGFRMELSRELGMVDKTVYLRGVPGQQ